MFDVQNIKTAVKWVVLIFLGEAFCILGLAHMDQPTIAFASTVAAMGYVVPVAAQLLVKITGVLLRLTRAA